jgi:hypothetical protein
MFAKRAERMGCSGDSEPISLTRSDSVIVKIGDAVIEKGIRGFQHSIIPVSLWSRFQKRIGAWDLNKTWGWIALAD